MIDTSEDFIIVTLSDNEKSLLKKILEIFLQNQWKPSQNNLNLEMEDKKILQSMNVSVIELWLSQLVTGPESHNANSPFQSMVAAHKRSKEIMTFKCTYRDNYLQFCDCYVCVTKKEIFVFKNHSEECLKTEKLYDINLLQQKIGNDLWSSAISHVTCICKINASQDDCFKSFKDYIKGTITISFTIIHYQYDLYGTVYKKYSRPVMMEEIKHH